MPIAPRLVVVWLAAGLVSQLAEDAVHADHGVGESEGDGELVGGEPSDVHFGAKRVDGDGVEAVVDGEGWGELLEPRFILDGAELTLDDGGGEGGEPLGDALVADAADDETVVGRECHVAQTVFFADGFELVIERGVEVGAAASSSLVCVHGSVLILERGQRARSKVLEPMNIPVSGREQTPAFPARRRPSG